jgi:hypothetical protein
MVYCCGFSTEIIIDVTRTGDKKLYSRQMPVQLRGYIYQQTRGERCIFVHTAHIAYDRPGRIKLKLVDNFGRGDIRRKRSGVYSVDSN